MKRGRAYSGIANGPFAESAAPLPGPQPTPPELDNEAAASPTSAAPRQTVDGAPVLTVSELNRAIRDALERHIGMVWVAGEVSNLRVPASGHCYFTLKDELAQIAAVIWRTQLANLRFELKEGLSVLVQGEVSVYEPRGQYQVIVRRVEPVGLGALQLAFLQLKERLAKEGLFDPARKRPLPFFPQTVALVTSPTGAAVHDMIRTIRARCPGVRLLVCPVRVQGDEAAREIAEGIALVNRLDDVDVMIVGRGGGSLEDLWPFNEEIVARAIAASRVPVVSAVGHETDFTIADFVADVRARTPTEAGHLVVPDVRQLSDQLDAYRERLVQALAAKISSARERLDAISRRTEARRFLEGLRAREQRLDELCQRLVNGIQQALKFQGQRLEAAGARLDALSPLAVLQRGYSITFRADGLVLRDAAALKPGDLVRTRLARGEFKSRVE